jgi:SAM-dependent methyltransferase
MRQALFKAALLRFSMAGGDRRSAASELALARLLQGREPGGLVVSVGGGPTRVAKGVRNLNIAPLPQVDIVADAHALPFRNEVLAGLHCEAVLEHLEKPGDAVAEMYRVAKPGALVFSATPFLQAFHGYPSHFQNFTRPGHELLFRRAGFSIVAAGCCVGPVYAMADAFRYAVRQFVGPEWLARAFAAAVWLASWPFRVLDSFLANQTGADRLCSTTFVLAEKPRCSTPAG